VCEQLLQKKHALHGHAVTTLVHYDRLNFPERNVRRFWSAAILKRGDSNQKRGHSRADHASNSDSTRQAGDSFRDSFVIMRKVSEMWAHAML